MHRLLQLYGVHGDERTRLERDVPAARQALLDIIQTSATPTAAIDHISAYDMILVAEFFATYYFASFPTPDKLLAFHRSLYQNAPDLTSQTAQAFFNSWNDMAPSWQRGHALKFY
jgi:Mlc titration factor MtfA (ptsG expression regulator)